MWQRLKMLLKRPDPAPGRAVRQDKGSSTARTGPDVGETRGGSQPGPATKGAVSFRRYYQYPNLFEFNLEKLDINLLIYPKSGLDADRDAVLLIVFGCEEVLGLDRVNEAYLCRKLGEAKDGANKAAQGSFDAVYTRTARLDAQDIVDACVGGGELDRVSAVAGGDVRLTTVAREIASELAFDLNRGG